MKNQLLPIAECRNKKDMTVPSLVNLRIMLGRKRKRLKFNPQTKTPKIFQKMINYSFSYGNCFAIANFIIFKTRIEKQKSESTHFDKADS